MRKRRGANKRFGGDRGVVLILVALAVFVLIGLAALAIDVGHLYVVRNELKNAADAGALAGARVLYSDDGTVVREAANQDAYDAAAANRSEKLPVEVDWSGGNGGDVERGHWSFAAGAFVPNASLAPVNLWNVTAAELDANLDFINAVRVRTRREATPVTSFFARIFGFDHFASGAESVAYIGFAGSLQPGEVDQPIAMCRQSILDGNGRYSCSTGRMIDSGGGATQNSGAWTNFSQPCQTASASSVGPLVCRGGNPLPIVLGAGMGTVGGMQDTVYRDLRDCWRNAPLPRDWRGYPTEAWKLTVPVIDCPGNNPGPCSDVVGTVTLDTVWIKQSGTDPQWRDIPVRMEGWECPRWVALGRPSNINALTSDERQECWRGFASHFNLKSANGTSAGTLTASQIQKSIFILPNCEPHIPRGGTGGQNFGVLAKIPVLVR